MCSISGYSGHFRTDLLNDMNAVLQHRGPDDQGIFVSKDQSIGLAHRRLSIIDLSPQGQQPMRDPETGHWIAFNGEIYNYRALRESLQKKGEQFRTQTDTEVLLKLYAVYGTGCLQYLDGIFSFAIFDARKNQLFIARDHFGVKPLYYAQTQKGFLFASELKALLQEASVSRELDLQAIDYSIRYLWTPAPHTMLQAVKKLEPGCALIVKQQKISKQWRYYDLPHTDQYTASDADTLADELRQLLSDSVQSQLVSDVPVGAFLSGGLDSSSIVALAKQSHPDLELPCFTMRFNTQDKQQVSDLPYAQKVAQQLGVPLHVIDAHPKQLQNIAAMVYALDEPQADPAAINAYLISSLARDSNIKVLLSGAGGDDLFTGYRRHRALLMNQHLMKLPLFARKAAAKLSRLLPQSHPLLRRVSKGLGVLPYTHQQHLTSYFHWLAPSVQAGLYTPDVAKQMLDHDVLQDSLARLPKNIHPLNQMLYLEGKHFLADHNLNYTDKMAMATGVEVRVPFLNKKLAAFASKLPISMKQKGREGKWLLKKAMQPLLDQDIIYRPKTGFGVPLRQWLKTDLNPMMQDILSESRIKQRGLFDSQAVAQLMQHNAAGKIDASYPILSLMCIEIWCQQFIDSAVPTAVSFE